LQSAFRSSIADAKIERIFRISKCWKGKMENGPNSGLLIRKKSAAIFLFKLEEAKR